MSVTAPAVAATTAGTTAAQAAMGPAGWAMLAMQALPWLYSLTQSDPRKRYQKWLEQQLSAANVAQKTKEAFGGVVGSPAYQAALASIAQGANVTQSDIAANLAARGLGTSGTGAILGGLTPSIVGNQQAALYTKGYELANKQAMDNINALISGYGKTDPMGASNRETAFSTFLQAASPMLQQYLNSRVPKAKPLYVPAENNTQGWNDIYGSLTTPSSMYGGTLSAPRGGR